MGVVRHEAIIQVSSVQGPDCYYMVAALQLTYSATDAMASVINIKLFRAFGKIAG